MSGASSSGWATRCASHTRSKSVLPIFVLWRLGTVAAMAERLLSTRVGGVQAQYAPSSYIGLERSRLPLVRALERVGGIQAQYAPSSYIGLWSRLASFELTDLTRALERRRAVQGTLLRSTIHLVSAGDYWAFALGSRSARQAAWLRFDKKRLSNADLDSAAREVRAVLAGKVRHRDELLALARRRDPERPTHLWNGLGAWVELVRAPPSGTWERRRADLYALAADWLGPPDTTPEQGVELLLRRYLGAYLSWRLRGYPHWGAYRRIPQEVEAEWLARRAELAVSPGPARRG